MPRDGDPMKTPPELPSAHAPADALTGRVIVRNGRAFTLFVNRSPGTSTMSAYERSLYSPVCRVVDPSDVDADAGDAPCRRPNSNSKRIGTRNRSVVKVGRRRRRIFYVASEDLDRDDAWLAEPGWYVDTIRPPSSWISNDPLGPYATRAELQADTYTAFREEET